MTAADLESWPVVPDPTEEEIERVRRHAVALGGAALQNPHSKRSTVFRAKGLLRAPHREELTACYQIAEFTVPLVTEEWQESLAADRRGEYDSGIIEPTDVQKQANFTRLCAVDDGAHMWPRFQ